MRAFCDVLPFGSILLPPQKEEVHRDSVRLPVSSTLVTSANIDLGSCENDKIRVLLQPVCWEGKGASPGRVNFYMTYSTL